MSALLLAEGVTVFVRDRLVEPASQSLHAGRHLTILGEMGSGRSLLAQAIMRTLPAGLRAEGLVTINDQRILLATGQGHRSLLQVSHQCVPAGALAGAGCQSICAG